MRTITERIGLTGPPDLLALAAGGAGLLLAGIILPWLTARAPRVLITSVTSLGFWIALSSPSGATPRSTDHPIRPSDAPKAPWSPAEGPPPLPSVGAPGSLSELVSGKPQPHPAIHGGAGKVSGPLFPRLNKSPSVCSPDRELAECMNQHPAGRNLKKNSPDVPVSGEQGDAADATPTQHAKTSESGSNSSSLPALTQAQTLKDRVRTKQAGDVLSETRSSSGGDEAAMAARATKYVVQRGDSLWGIAEDILGSENKAQVARFWPAIHRLNRETIGRDPNYLIPGQVLHLPDPSKV